MGTRGSPTDKCSSSSIIYGGNTSLETIDRVLQQLKPKLTEADLFEVLGQSFLHGYGINSLLDKHDVPDAPTDVVNFVIEFGSLFV